MLLSPGHSRRGLGTEVDKEPLYGHLLALLERPGDQSQSGGGQ